MIHNLMRTVCSLGVAVVLLSAGVALAQSKPKGTMNLSTVRADLKTIDAESAKAIKDYDEAKAGGKDVSGPAAALAEVAFRVADHVDRSLAIDNQPADEPTLAAATEKLKSLSGELEKRGVWTCYRPGEATLVAKVFGQWKNYRAVMDDAVAKARQASGAAEAVAEAEAELAKQLAASADGKGMPDLGKHPAYARAKAEVARLKGQAPAAVAKPEPPKTGETPAAGGAAKPVAPAAPPAELKKGRGSGSLATVGDVVRRVKKGTATPDVELFGTLLGGYEGAIIAGWDERTPDLVTAKELLVVWFPKFEKELKTCYRPDEPLLAVDGAPVPLRYLMDKLLAEANKTLTWAKNPVNKSGAAAAVKKFSEEYETPFAAAIKRYQDAGKPADAAKHPACVRATTEMARIKAEMQAVAGAVAGAESAAAEVGKQFIALDATLIGNAQHEGLIPKDCRELFGQLIAVVANKNPETQCVGQPQQTLAAWLSLMPRLEKEVFPQVAKFVKDMRDRYGADEAAFQAKAESYRKDAGQHDPGMAYIDGAWQKLVKLEQAMGYLPGLKAAAVKSIMAFSKTKDDSALKTSTENPDYNTKMKEQNFLVLVPNLQVIVTVEPGNAQAKDLLDAVIKGAGGVKAAEDKAIDQADWVGRTRQFSGPGNPDDLEKNIFEYAKGGGWVGSPTNPYTVLAVAITGEWYSHKKNIFGDTIQWGLPVRVATKRTSDKGNDVVAVWFLSVLTQEGGPNVAKAPPWAQFAVGDSYRMRQAKFDQQVKK